MPSKAARALEAALVNQFGESARGTVEAEVGSFLRRSGIRGFQRSDLDAIENGILEKVKEKRQVCHVSSVGQASVPIKAEETPRPKSAATLTTEVRGSKSAPQLAVLAMAPKPQLLKAPDCFDLWREFDSMQHASEEAEKRRNKQAQAKRYLEALNEQLQQAQARKDAEVVEKQRDRQAILEEVQRSHRNASAELQKKQQKKQLQKEAALDLLARVEKQKGAAVQRLQVAKMAMDRTLAAEEQYRQQELLKQQKHREDESLLMRRQYESSQAAQQDSKQKEKEADQRLASEWKRIAAKPPEAELPGGMLHKIRENQKRVDTLVDTMGVALVQKQRAQDAAEEQRVQRDCRAYEKKRLEELFARQDQRTRRTREMVEGFRKKIQEGNNKGADEKAADQWQAEVWRQSRETAEAEEAKKQMLKREARKELDKQLFADMMKTTGMKKLRRPGNLEQDLLLNRPLVEQMVKSGYKTELTVPMLEKALDLKAEQARKRVESR